MPDNNALIRIQKESHVAWEIPDYPRIEKIVSFVRNYFKKTGKMLDLGYCPGSFADYFSRDHWHCVGADICQRPKTDFPFLISDLSRVFPFQNESFDLVTAGELIEHMIDQEAFLDECSRVLRPNGLLVITTPNMSFTLNRLLIPLGHLPMFVTAPFHFHFHNKKSLEAMLTARGLKIAHLSSSHVLYSRRRHTSGILFEWLGSWFPTWGAHLIAYATKKTH